MDILHISRPRHIGDWIALEYDQNYCRDSGTLDAGAAALVLARTVIGLQSIGALSGAFSATGAHGNPTCGTITVAAGSPLGEYDVIMDDATHFHVLGPHGEGPGLGEAFGDGVFGSAFTGGGLGFTLTAGGTACNPGDELKITVTDVAGDGKYWPVSAAATDGTQNAVGVVVLDTDSTNGDAPVSFLARGPAIIRSAELIWPSGASTNQKNAWIAQLQVLGIKVVISG